MRVLLLVVATILASLAGCLGDNETAATGDPEIPPPRPLCSEVCEVAVDTSDRRAFEPTAALNPQNADQAVVVSTLFRDSEDLGHPMDFYIHVTTDRGATWATQRFWDVLPLNHPVKQYNMWADPMTRWLDDGTLILLGMGGTGANPPEGPAPVLGFTGFDIWIARSLDGGATWPEGGVIFEGSGLQGFAPTPHEYGDQPHIAVGPDGTILVGFVQVVSSPLGTTQDILAVQSANSGASWTQPVWVASGPSYHNPRPAILADGTMFMAHRGPADAGSAMPTTVLRSRDGGATWQSLQEFASNARPTLAASGNNLHLVVAPPGTDGGLNDVVMHSSSDGGDHWTTTRLDTAEREDGIIVSSAGTPNGTLYATWTKPVAGGGNEFWGVRSTGSGVGVTARLDTTPLGGNPIVGPPELTWSSLGDYFGLAASADGALAAWVSGEGSGQDVRAAWLHPPAPF